MANREAIQWLKEEDQYVWNNLYCITSGQPPNNVIKSLCWTESDIILCQICIFYYKYLQNLGLNNRKKVDAMFRANAELYYSPFTLKISLT